MSIRVVLDTNAVVSGLLFPRSVARQAIQSVRKEHTLLISEALATEMRTVLARPVFDQVAERGLRLRVLAALLEETEPVIISERIQVCRDPNDDMVLELALSGRADVVISSDADLIVLHPFRGIPILQPAEFLRRYPPAGAQRYNPEA